MCNVIFSRIFTDCHPQQPKMAIGIPKNEILALPLLPTEYWLVPNNSGWRATSDELIDFRAASGTLQT
jgi:hypothetical protein